MGPPTGWKTPLLPLRLFVLCLVRPFLIFGVPLFRLKVQDPSLDTTSSGGNPGGTCKYLSISPQRVTRLGIIGTLRGFPISVGEGSPFGRKVLRKSLDIVSFDIYGSGLSKVLTEVTTLVLG